MEIDRPMVMQLFLLTHSNSAFRAFKAFTLRYVRARGLASKLYIPSTLNTDYLLWHTQLPQCFAQGIKVAFDISSSVSQKKNCQ